MKKKALKSIFLLVFIFIISYLSFYFMSELQYEEKGLQQKTIVVEEKLGDVTNNVNPTLYVATDELGRTLPTTEKKTTNHYRAVGVFYWTWHLEHGKTSNKPYNVNNIMKTNPTRSHDWNWWNTNYSSNHYWWNEPIYGYYMENDDYVLRKQAELLADAGVDFIVFDCTNKSYTWKTAYENLLKVWSKAKSQGVNVPKIAFMFNFTYSSDTYTAFMNVYNNLYKPGTDNYNKYNSLFFKYNGKPLVLLQKEKAPTDMKNILKKFEVRGVDSSYTITGAQANGKWGWLSVYPQAYYKKANGSPEQISVGVAQNYNYKTGKLSAMNGNNIAGRSWSKGDYLYKYNYRGSTITVGNSISGSTVKNKNISLYGRNFQQQWDYAIKIDPEIIFVTGWNEWNMSRFQNIWDVTNGFPDQYNDEYSRDIEPSKGDLKDNYYYQLVSNIRKYKGVSSQSTQNTAVTINSTSDWNNSNIISYNHYVGGNNRNIAGFGKTNPPTYVNQTFRNDIKTAKVSYDSKYIYFYVQTVNKLTSYDSSKWMRLLIDTKTSTTSKDVDNWEEFEYIVNRNKGAGTTLTLEKSKGGWNFTKVGDISYKVSSNVLELKIPRLYLGLKDSKISFNFKWCDNNLDNGNIMTVYTDGDAAPGGRFAFHFEGKAEYVPITTSPSETPSKKGDVNGDNKVNALDYLMIKKHILKQVTLTSNELKQADVNNDGKINALDYLAVKKIILKLI